MGGLALWACDSSWEGTVVADGAMVSADVISSSSLYSGDALLSGQKRQNALLIVDKKRSTLILCSCRYSMTST